MAKPIDPASDCTDHGACVPRSSDSEVIKETLAAVPASTHEELVVPSASHPATGNFWHELRSQSTARERRQLYKRTAAYAISQRKATHPDQAQGTIQPHTHNSTATPSRQPPTASRLHTIDSPTVLECTALAAPAVSETLHAPAVDVACRTPIGSRGTSARDLDSDQPARWHGTRPPVPTAGGDGLESADLLLARASPLPNCSPAPGAADGPQATSTTPTPGRLNAPRGGPAAPRDALRGAPEFTAGTSTGNRLARHRTSTSARHSRFQPLAFVESPGTALQHRPTADRTSEHFGRASTLDRMPNTDGVLHGTFSYDVSVVSHHENPEAPGTLTTSSGNWRGIPVGMRIFPERPVPDSTHEEQTARLAGKRARTDRPGPKELSDPPSWALALPCTPPSPTRESITYSPPATASWPSKAAQLAYSTSD